jgi:hypothetical protein
MGRAEGILGVHGLPGGSGGEIATPILDGIWKKLPSS